MLSSNVKKRPNANTFNPTDWGYSGVFTNYGTSEAFVNIETDFDQSQFIKKSGDIVTGDLVMQGTSKLIFTDGSLQTVAFDEGNVNAIADVVDKLQYINVSSNLTNISSYLYVCYVYKLGRAEWQEFLCYFQKYFLCGERLYECNSAGVSMS